ncbi:MAG: MarR family winged helix-turn-helix transcriptional regulator [Dehalococcoidia bacterium]
MTSDPIDDAINAFSRAMFVVEPLRLKLWEERELTVSQLRITYMIRDRNNPSLGELADELGITGATMSGLIDRLTKRGVVERLPDATDRRVVRVRLTEEGQRLSRELQRTGREFLRLVFERMGPETAAELAHALVPFIAANQELIADGTYGRLLNSETTAP